ncbi:DNA mismatch repair protein MutT [Jeotgalicoccus coquinae]|uniref:NUDIX domain protein n=1 Tax=Jeotgalicoccus coquinae TaxID=709509 RepID=A0A6V7R7J3_9STAP|nr:NUDIX domain-containing protein [Jeotgalicoccus coquinae]MBB6423078.1 putative NUDIX family phosphoesterase [Jeotgalicoccus coquinae]GGE10836.1 DNA mismatch repair protein MutT [Jeotgalicoccus coquinae]CAD2073457.1 NUDIX domain protein [Jeotgalicoccus coquinae]
MSKFDEQILVVNRDTLFDGEQNAFNGFISKDDNRYKEIVKSFGGFEVKRRGDMEEDPGYKQLISYCIITNGDETLVYKRLAGGGESRLHGLLSIGVGGHMNDVESEADINGKLRVNAARELEEEVGLTDDDVKNIEIHGLINDDDNEVGRVHIGLVLKIDVEKEKVINNEEDTIALEWVKNDILETMSPYESWSELIIRDAYGQ